MYRHIEAYSHYSKIGVLVELETEDDFTANTPDFKQLAKDIALQITAMKPVGISPIDNSNIIHLWPNLVESNFTDLVLLKQKFIKDLDITVENRIKEIEEKLLTYIKIIRFVRFSNDEI